MRCFAASSRFSSSPRAPCWPGYGNLNGDGFGIGWVPPDGSGCAAGSDRTPCVSGQHWSDARRAGPATLAGRRRSGLAGAAPARLRTRASVCPCTSRACRLPRSSPPSPRLEQRSAPVPTPALQPALCFTHTSHTAPAGLHLHHPRLEQREPEPAGHQAGERAGLCPRARRLPGHARLRAELCAAAAGAGGAGCCSMMRLPARGACQHRPAHVPPPPLPHRSQAIPSSGAATCSCTTEWWPASCRRARFWLAAPGSQRCWMRRWWLRPTCPVQQTPV